VSTPDPPDDQPMTAREFLEGVGEHVNELRQRLLKAVLALGLTTAASFFLAEQLLELLAGPIGGLQNLQSIEVTENVSVFMRVSLLSGFVLAFPVIAYQLLAFLMPGLEPNERRYVLWFVPAATLLFACGVAFAYFVMLPVTIPFLLTFLGIPTEVRPASYIHFVTGLLFWMGMVFETPLVVFGLAKFRIVSAAALLKHSVAAPRPFMLGLGTEWLGHSGGNGFPSSHAAVAMAFAVSMALGPWRWPWRAAAVLCGLLVGWSRIALGVHFPTDVLAAALLGTACACGVYTLAGRVRSLAWAP